MYAYNEKKEKRWLQKCHQMVKGVEIQRYKGLGER